MQFRTNLFILACLSMLLPAVWAEEKVSPSEESVSAVDTNDANTLPFPYIAEITANDVYVRSGPGTNYYSCGKLNQAEKVIVVGSKFSWSQIVPPAGSFSWISQQYVSIDSNKPDIGIVTGNKVRVYAGSDYKEPIHSTTMQQKLDEGHKVSLLGEEKDGYYKIAPPKGVYLWVSTQYTRAIAPVTVEIEKLELQPAAEVNTPPTPMVVPTKISIEAQKLKDYRSLQKQIETERAKPMEQQNYTEIKKSLTKIAGDKKAGKAGRYSNSALKQIRRFELALAAKGTVKSQEIQLQQVNRHIEDVRQKKLAKIRDLGKFAIIGEFQTSLIYGPEEQLKHYRILDDSGSTLCYALASGPAAKVDLDKFVGKKVGLIGSIEPYPQTSGALVQFIEVVELK